jgi:hypothetical protein
VQSVPIITKVVILNPTHDGDVLNDLRQVFRFLPGTPVSSTNKTDRHDITEILLIVALKTMTKTIKFNLMYGSGFLCYFR